jgi:tetratricopeptide (TPR) repeat protein
VSLVSLTPIFSKCSRARQAVHSPRRARLFRRCQGHHNNAWQIRKFAQWKFERAQQAVQQGYFVTALAFLDDADEADPNQPLILNLRGETLMERKEFDLAEVAFRAAIKIDPKFLKAQQNLAEIPFKKKAAAEASPSESAKSDTNATGYNSLSARNNRTWQAWIGEFVSRFVSANQLQDVDANLGFYAPNVNYFDDGPKDQVYIRNDIQKYNERWPARRDSIEGDIHLQEKASDKQYAASFKLDFYAESSARAEWSKGQFSIDLDISILDGVPKISGIKEKVLRQQKGNTKVAASDDTAASVTPAGKIFAGKWRVGRMFKVVTVRTNFGITHLR